MTDTSPFFDAAAARQGEWTSYKLSINGDLTHPKLGTQNGTACDAGGVEAAHGRSLPVHRRMEEIAAAVQRYRLQHHRHDLADRQQPGQGY